MGRFFKDSYASTYAARNVKEALDRLIDVLQSPAHLRKLVIGTSCTTSSTATGASRKPGVVKQGSSKLSSESSASAAPVVSMHTTTTAKKKQTRSDCKGGELLIDAPLGSSTHSSSEKKKSTATPTVTTATVTCSGSSQTSNCCNSSSDHIPVGRFSQLWKKSLRDYPSRRSCGNVYNSKERQRSSTPQLVANWSSVPCKSRDFEFGC